MQDVQVDTDKTMREMVAGHAGPDPHSPRLSPAPIPTFHGLRRLALSRRAGYPVVPKGRIL